MVTACYKNLINPYSRNISIFYKGYNIMMMQNFDENKLSL